MTMKKEDLDLLIRHAEATSQKEHFCPVCGGKNWIANGLYTLATLDELEDGKIASNFRTIMPLAVIRCPNCQYIEMFAWRPIQEWAKNNA